MGDEGPVSEREAHFGPGGPAETARAWLSELVTNRDVRAAWRLTDPDYRLALTQAIIFLNDQHPLIAGQDRDRLAASLAEEDPVNPLWDAFAQLLSEEFLHDLGEIRIANLEAITPRPVAPGYELVLFAHNPERDLDVIEPAEMRAHGVLVHLRDDRWLVAGMSERRAVPGWPPDLGY